MKDLKELEKQTEEIEKKINDAEENGSDKFTKEDMKQFSELIQDVDDSSTNKSGEEMIDDIIENLDYSDTDFDKQDLKDILKEGQDYNAVLTRIQNRVLVRLVTEEPNILTLLYTTDTEGIDVYENTADIVVNDLTYYLKPEYTLHDATMVDYVMTDEGRSTITRVFAVPDLNKVFTVFKDNKDLFKNYMDTYRAYVEASSAITDSLREVFLNNNVKRARKTMSDIFLNIDEITEIIKWGKENKVNETTVSYYRGNLSKKVAKIHKHFQLDELLDTLLDYIDIVVDGNKDKKNILFYAFLKMWSNKVDRDNLVYLITFRYSLGTFLRYGYLTMVGKEEDKPELENLEKELELDDLPAFTILIKKRLNSAE